MQVWVIPGARDMKLCCATLGAAVDVCQLVDSAERFISVSKSVHDFVLKTLLYVHLERRFTGWNQAT